MCEVKGNEIKYEMASESEYLELKSTKHLLVKVSEYKITAPE